MSYEKLTVKGVLSKINNGDMYLPAIQRKYVWDEEQITKLLDSILLGYPIGTFLFWDIGGKIINEKEYSFYEFILDYHERDKYSNDHAPSPIIKERILGVLDGQQRLTSLFIALQGSLSLKLPRKRRDNDASYPKKQLYFNLLSKKENIDDEITYEFKFLTENEAERSSEQLWYKVKNILTVDSTKQLMALVVSKGWNENPLVIENISTLWEYLVNKEIINYFKISKDSIDDVLDIFVRVNSGGTILSKSDLLFSTIVSHWDKARDEIEELLKTINKIGEKFNFNNDFIMRTCLYLSDVSITLKVETFKKNNVEGIKNQWVTIKDSIIKTVSLLNEFGFSYSVRSKEDAPPPINVAKTIEEAVLQSPDLQKVELKTQPQRTYVEGQKNVYNRDVLYNEVWNEPVTTVAKKYGVSDVAIHKVCKTLSIPVPPRGYWAIKNAGHPIKRTPLPEHDGPSQKIGIKSFDDSATKSESASNEAFSFLNEDEKIRLIIAAQQITISDDKCKLHPKLNSHKAKIKAWRISHSRDELAPRNRDTYRRIPDGEPFLYNDISDVIFPRVYRILNALFQYVEALGGSVNDNLSLKIRNETVYYSITEGQDQVPHVLTKDEQKQWDQYERDKKSRSWAYEPRFRKWDYIPNGKLRFSAKANSYFRDSETIGLELRLGDILIALFEESENVRIEREKREETHRKEEEEKRQRELKRERYNQEVEKVLALENEAKDYDLACKIRAYVSAVESKEHIDESTLKWIEWAKEKADWYDPTVAASDSNFGKRKHAQDKDSKKPKKAGYGWW